MPTSVDKPKRSFIKKVILAAGAVLAVGSKKASAKKDSHPQDEILYRETEAFRAYYESLRR